MPEDQLNLSNYYRLPWSLTDNGISWLEVTTRCNLACKGCYRDAKKEGHKTLAEIDEDIAVFRRERKSDCMSIAGGEPLLHPEIVEIVRRVAAGGWKPIVNTNGLSLTADLLRDLKTAGVHGFTFHIDTSQVRRDSKETTEAGHNALRQRFAEQLAAAGGIACSFNQTVSNETLDQVPDVVEWALRNPALVSSMVFILYREPRLFGDFRWYAGAQEIDPYASYKQTGNDWSGQRVLQAPDVIAKIREVDARYEPSAYLNGTVSATSAKWLVATRLAMASGETLGYLTPRTMELIQETYHLTRKRWMSYASPRLLSMGRSLIGLGSLLDGRLRRTVGARYAGRLLRNPLRALSKVFVQSFAIIQPIDILADGRMDMCDGCPDMTVYKGKMYWSCRLEEIKEHGRFLDAVPQASAELIASSALSRSAPMRFT